MIRKYVVKNAHHKFPDPIVTFQMSIPFPIAVDWENHKIFTFESRNQWNFSIFALKNDLKK